MLEVINLTCVRGDRRLFKNLSFSIAPGEFLELRGSNGVGKTSLLRILCGLATPTAGEVRWKGTKIRSLGEKYLGSIAYVAHQNGVKDELTAIENLLVSERIGGNSLSRSEAEATLERVDLAKQQNLLTRLLSAGQRRRLAIARILASRAKLWIMDEILASLDDAGISLTREIIIRHCEEGGLAILATHQNIDLNARVVRRLDLTT